MTDEEKIKNIFAFLSILFGDDKDCFKKIMDFSPAYLIEKFEAYILSTRSESDWGLHPSLRRRVFNTYCKKYELPITDWSDE